MDLPRFVFVTCQPGAESAVKREMAVAWPDFRFAYSRSGFLTFKLPEQYTLTPDFELGTTFVRSAGFSLGEVIGASAAEMAAHVWKLYGSRPLRRIHVWQRDRRMPGDRGFEPGATPETREVHNLLVESYPPGRKLPEMARNPDIPAQIGDLVLDCILLDANRWWIGFHQASNLPTQWPGGVLPLKLPENAVSRAWLKMEEGLRWSELPIPAEARVCELGSAPGGASQALLARGWFVLGVDPAEMNPLVLGHPRFTHLRKKSNQVRRREFRKIRWLTADMNVAPQYTLDVVESIVTHAEVNVRGLLLTLKLFEWELADELPNFLARIRRWGYNLVRARQLVHNRQEVCVAALQHPFRRKTPARLG